MFYGKSKRSEKKLPRILSDLDIDTEYYKFYKNEYNARCQSYYAERMSEYKAALEKLIPTAEGMKKQLDGIAKEAKNSETKFKCEILSELLNTKLEKVYSVLRINKPAS